MPEAGLVSVTLRARPREEVARVAHAAGLACIEWGADVHAPPTEPAAVDRCRELSDRYGLRVASYGSYWRAGVTPVSDGAAVLDAAVRLGAPRVRIWAGGTASDIASPEVREATRVAIGSLAAQAYTRGIELAIEFHPDTMTDTAATMLAMLDDVDAPNVSTYWQPGVGQPDGEALDELEQLVDRVSAVHVFAWWPTKERRPLAERAALWRPAVAMVTARRPTADIMLEFVPDDDPALVAPEAQTLLSWLT